MNQRGTFICLAAFFAGFFATQTSFAQHTEPKKTLDLRTKIRDTVTKDRSQGGYFSMGLGSKVNTYKSQPMKLTPQALDFNRTQQGFTTLRQSTQSLKIDQLIQFRNVTLPDFTIQKPNVSLEQLEMIVNKRAIEQFINTQLVQFEPLAQNWQPHIDSMEQIINHSNIDSIVDLPALSQTLYQYIQQNNLLPMLEEDFAAIQNWDWGNLSIQDFINQDELQNTLDQFNEHFNLAQVSAQDFLQMAGNHLDTSFHQSISDSLATLHKTGFSFQHGKLQFRDPRDATNQFSFTPGDSSATGDCQISENGNLSGYFAVNAGNCIVIEGSGNFNTNQTLTNLQQNAEGSIQNIIVMLQNGIQNGTSLDELLSQMQTEINSISQSALPTVLQEIENNFESDFSITLNLQAMSDGFQGSGDYQFIDIILETLGHDVGSITLNKDQILAIAEMMKNGNESQVGQYILEDVAGYKTDIVGYNIARDVANTYLSEHFTGNIIALQQSINGGGGLIQTGQSFYGSTRIRQGPKASWAFTGTFNQRSINNSPVLKKDGLLHLRTELESSSIGIAYLPKLWKYNLTSTTLTGIVQVEGLFVRAKSASVLTKTTLVEQAGQEVVELYRIPLNEIEGAEKTYTLPMLSLGLNLEQKINKVFSVNGFAIMYPGLAQQGTLTEIPKAIVPRFQTGVSFIINIMNNNQNTSIPAGHLR